ncbi:MAG TPA: hypothetical protein VLZ28_03270, partial [Daejeonella sp.]|nr:hypothetical protein [Daejeonella sp.]
MINIKRFLVIIASTVVIVSCSKDFLEVNPQGQLTETQALSDPGAAEKLVGGVYNTLYFGGLFDPTTVGILLVMAGDVASDDGEKGSTPGDYPVAGELDNFTV